MSNYVMMLGLLDGDEGKISNLMVGWVFAMKLVEINWRVGVVKTFVIFNSF